MIDRYDAPDGMIAVRKQDRYTCTGCKLDNGRSNCDYDSICPAEVREDETDVIFKTRDEFEKMLLAEIEAFYGNGKVVKRIIFTKDNIK